jgi:hypothetical protein
MEEILGRPEFNRPTGWNGNHDARFWITTHLGFAHLHVQTSDPGQNHFFPGPERSLNAIHHGIDRR